MNFFKGIIAELRDRRLWPVAVALLIAIVAVPVVLSKSPSTPSPQPLRGSGSGGSGAHGVAVTLQGTPVASLLKGRPRDPFAQQTHASLPTTSARTSTSTSTASTATTGSTASTSASSAATGASTAASGGGTAAATTPASSAATTTPAPATNTPAAPHKPAPTGLTGTQSYHVTLAITNADGGLNQIDPLERLSVLPSQQQPLLVELGVANGGGLVLFAVQPGTALSGPGVCIPGTIDCQILTLAQGQTETLADGTSFQVTRIGIDEHSSAAAADKARAMESAAGRTLYKKSTLTALSLFPYESTLGAVADARNLKVGGN